MIAIGYCPHGVIATALKVKEADSAELRDFATSHTRVELKKNLDSYGGLCTRCHETYLANCALLGVQP